MIKTNSLPVKKVLELIAVPYGEEFSFILTDKTVKTAEKFVHNMRVELSRLRTKVREKHNRVPIAFKVLTKKIEPLGNGIVKVTLVRTQNETNKVEMLVDKELEGMLGGTHTK